MKTCGIVISLILVLAVFTPTVAFSAEVLGKSPSHKVGISPVPVPGSKIGISPVPTPTTRVR